MVAASKMRRAQEAVLGTRAYAQQGYNILARLGRSLSSEKQLAHPLLTVRPVKNIALVVISSDRGLAGGYNVNVMKRALQFLSDNKDKNIQVITIGRKAQESLARAGIQIEASFTDFPGRPISTDLRPVAKLTVDAFLKGECDQVSVVYTNFYSTLKQVAEVRQIVPVIAETSEGENSETRDEDSAYLFEPDPSKVLSYIVPRLVEVQLLETVLESIASEHSSRMLAMKSATDNASDLIDDLKLTYNSIRQASITKELAEITAGSAAN